MTASLPKTLYSCAQARAIDSNAISRAGIAGFELMTRAGCAAFALLMEKWPQVEQLIVFCGRGNNGGDGYVVAALAAEKQIPLQLFSIGDPNELQGDAKKAHEKAISAGVDVQDVSRFDTSTCKKNTVIVDGILGIGCQGELKPLVRNICQSINQQKIPVLALDIPTGLNGDTGWAAQDTIAASVTMTFVGLKIGLFTGRGPALCGEVHFNDLNIPEDIYELTPSSVERREFASPLPKRAADAHKGDSGHVLVIGGDVGMGGAALLAAEAALRAGAGLVSLATRPEHISASLSRLPEVMVKGVDAGIALIPLIERADVVVIGPGLGQNAWSEQLLDHVLHANLPAVLDADALNLVAKKNLPLKGKGDWVMTPHPGEAARLLVCSGQDIQSDRLDAVERLQKKYGGVAILKGAGSLIYDGETTCLANVGNPGMAVAGMGDVLSGVIGAFLAQGLSPMEATCNAVCVHAAAADRAAENGQRGLRASDLMHFIQEKIN